MSEEKGKRKVMGTVGFGVAMAVVLGAALFFGAQDNVPRMPSDHPEVGPAHTLRINVKGELLGTEADPPVDLTLTSPPGTEREFRKLKEKRVNEGCRACHATLPPHHPPKQECIKCHRMKAPDPARSALGPKPTPPATPPANP